MVCDLRMVSPGVSEAMLIAYVELVEQCSFVTFVGIRFRSVSD